MSDDDVIERVARAIDDIKGYPSVQEQAAAALAALRAGDTLPNGLVVEHMEPMERAAWEYAREAMRNAAKDTP